MSHLLHIDLVVVLVRADPLDPHDTFVEVSGYYQAIVVPFDIEHDPVGRDDAGRRVAALYIRPAGPPRLLNFGEPSVQGAFQRRMVFVPSPSIHELSQRQPIPRNSAPGCPPPATSRRPARRRSA